MSFNIHLALASLGLVGAFFAGAAFGLTPVALFGLSMLLAIYLVSVLIQQFAELL
jgi:hypothetical protein